MKFRHLVLFAAALGMAGRLPAWDYAGHRMVNQLALAALPDDFPAFVHEPANAERIAFLAGEPDRWRNNPDLPIQHYNGMDHYLDLEELGEAGLALSEVSDLRYQFALQFAAGRAAHADSFPAVDPAKNRDHSREWPGFLPWAVTEYYGKLKSAFSYLKALEKDGTPEEVANAKQNILYVMGVMGHYVGDGSQPLHATVYHHGWFGENPHGYTTDPKIHSWIDGGFIAAAGITPAEILPQVTKAEPIDLTPRADGRSPVFIALLDYIEADNAQVEHFFEMEKAGRFRVQDGHVDPAGRAYIDGRLLTGGEMLARIWVTAWRNAPLDTYLERELQKRAAKAR